jgi:hypothetical protein
MVIPFAGVDGSNKSDSRPEVRDLDHADPSLQRRLVPTNPVAVLSPVLAELLHRASLGIFPWYLSSLGIL